MRVHKVHPVAVILFCFVFVAKLVAQYPMLEIPPSGYRPAGDVNGDGMTDFLVANVVYSGTDGAVLLISAWQDLIPFGDYNGDGKDDFYRTWTTTIPTTSTYYPPPPPTYYADVRIISGADDSIIGSHTVGNNYGGIGTLYGYGGVTFQPMGDINGDGKSDLGLTIVPFLDGAYWLSSAGRRRIWSALGNIIYDVVIPAPVPLATTVTYHGPLVPLGDVNGDAYADFAFATNGTVQVLRGPQGTSHFSFSVPYAQNLERVKFAGIGDTNGDGRGDIAVGDYTADIGATDTGVVKVLSGQNGATLLTVPGIGINANFGDSIVGIGDADGDGYADFVASNQNDIFISYPLRVISGHTGATLGVSTHAVAFPASSYVFSVGDMNGDGRGDYFYHGSFFSPGLFVESVLPLTSATSVAFGQSCGSGIVLSTTPPRLGHAFTVSVVGAPTPALGVLLASLPTSSPTQQFGGPNFLLPCEIYVDYATVFVASLIEPDPMGQWSLTGTISTGPLAEGLAMTLQACFWPEVGGFYASQGVALTLGY